MTHKLLAALVMLFALSACGQSGPLYIPGDPSRMEVPPENPENTQQTTQEEDEDGSSQ